MHLERLSIVNFKNIREAQIDIPAGINCFTGDNGTGKTNLMDAVYFLSMGKSAFNLTDLQCITHEEPLFALSGKYISADGRTENITCAYKRGQSKKLNRGGKEYEKLSDHMGLIPIVLIAPSDTALINDSGEERRKYINTLISQLDREYLSSLIRYNRLLAERNKLLKESSTHGFDEILEVMDMQLAPLGAVIHARRSEFIQKIAPLAASYYERLSGDKEKVEVEYRSALNDAPFDTILREAGRRDRMNMYTTSGIHRDDIIMTIDSYPLRRYGSQGQQKSFLIALKLAQYDIVASHGNSRPILLLDDIFDKLDMERVKRLIDIVTGDNFSQIFITDCNKVRLEKILEDNGCRYTMFNVSDGRVTSVKPEAEKNSEDTAFIKAGPFNEAADTDIPSHEAGIPLEAVTDTQFNEADTPFETATDVPFNEANTPFETAVDILKGAAAV